MKTQQGRPASVLVLFILQAFLGIGAIAGGVGLLADTSGETLGIPVSMMERPIFSDYLIPGLLLLAIFGLLPLLILYGLIVRPRWKWAKRMTPFRTLHSFWAFSLYIGFGLILWITIQTYILNSVSGIHLLYMGLGLLIQVVTLLPDVQKHYTLGE